MVLKIDIRGGKELKKYLIELPAKIDSALIQTNEQFLKDVRRSAKLRAPRDTSRTADSIKIERTKTRGKEKQWKLVVGSRAGFYQELGFKPHFVYSKDGYINGSSQKSSKFWSDGFHWVSKSKPFLVPALDSQLQKLDQKLNQEITKVMK